MFYDSLAALTRVVVLACCWLVIDIDENVPHNNGPLKIWSFKQSKLVNNLYSGWHLSTRACPLDVAKDKYKLELVQKNLLKYTFPTADAEFLGEDLIYSASAKRTGCYYEAIEDLKGAYRSQIQSTVELQTSYVYFRLPESVVLTKGIMSPKSINGIIKMNIVPMQASKKLRNGAVITMQPYASLSWNVILEGSEKPLGASSNKTQKSNADLVAELFGNFNI